MLLEVGIGHRVTEDLELDRWATPFLSPFMMDSSLRDQRRCEPWNSLWPPILKMLPALPILKMLPLLPMLRMLPELPMLKRLPTPPMLRILAALRRLRMLRKLRML